MALAPAEIATLLREIAQDWRSKESAIARVPTSGRRAASTACTTSSKLDHLGLAVAMARRARIRRHEVLNTLPADAFVRAVRPLRRRVA